ncbi:MAG: dCMP deaminase family protein [Oscillospiraceae bacterium]|nr:dCMP deaminase family protein [Oscillospiraceae bacterium]
MPKRENYISWDAYFMGIALLSAHRSKDPDTQVGACIVGRNNRIMSLGYNGLPRGCEDDAFSWDRPEKYHYVCHAELNAILNSGGRNLEGCKIYVALFPCNECAKAIVQCGIGEVLYLSDKYAETPAVQASKKMLRAAGVQLTQLDLGDTQITIDLRANGI